MSGVEQFLDPLSELGGSERLCHELVCAAEGGLLGYFRLGMGGQHEDLDVLRGVIGSEMTEDLPSVHPGETNIQHDYLGQ